MIIENLDEGYIKQRNRNTFLKQVQLFQTWCKTLVIKDPTLGTLPPICKERIFVSYALEIYQDTNSKNLPSLGVKSVYIYLRVAASHVNDNLHTYAKIGRA